MKRVIVESPYMGDIERNTRYARACMHHCLLRGEAPYASHLLYTQPGVLRDEIPDERTLGIEAGFVWRPVAELTVFFVDLGWSGGMKLAFEKVKDQVHPFEVRVLDGEWRQFWPADVKELFD